MFADYTRATGLTTEVVEAIDRDFIYHEWNKQQIEAGTNVRLALIAAVRSIIANVPPSPDRTVAIRKIREARMDCNSAITFGGLYAAEHARPL